YPTLPNVVTGPTKGLGYGLTLQELDRRAGEFNPIENLAPLAKAGAKILHLHGDMILRDFARDRLADVRQPRVRTDLKSHLLTVWKRFVFPHLSRQVL